MTAPAWASVPRIEADVASSVIAIANEAPMPTFDGVPPGAAGVSAGLAVAVLAARDVAVGAEVAGAQVGGGAGRDVGGRAAG